ncbi:MAG: hypothetical protein ACRD4D_06505 [Candidatus Acidiferrales bacterium]
MTPTAKSPAERADARPFDFHRWLVARGMNPNRRRPPGRTAALLMDYRRYLVEEVGPQKAGEWFEKYSPKAEPAVADSAGAEKSS